MLPDIELECLSDAELDALTARVETVRSQRRQIVAPPAAPGDAHRNGSPEPVVERPAGISEEFLAEFKRRIDLPSKEFLTVDEFLVALDEMWSREDAARS